MARAFLSEGPSFVRRMNGDFAAVIFDPRHSEVYLFRDHAGIRPLAYLITGDKLIFSTDAEGLSCSSGKEEPVESDYLLKQLKMTDLRKAPSGKVKKLLPGHYLSFSASGTNIVKYWFPENIKTDRSLTYPRMISDMKALVRDAVAIRCDARFTAGAHVSSGLDSTVVAALARKGYPRQTLFHGFSWSPGDWFSGEPENDERPVIREACQVAGIKPVFSGMDGATYTRSVSNYYENEAFFAEETTLRQARERKVNLIFSGWGGDEFVSCHERGIDYDLVTRMRWKTYCRRYPPRHVRAFIRSLLYGVVYPAAGILHPFAASAMAGDASYLKKEYQKSDPRAVRNFYFFRSRQKLHLQMLWHSHLQERTENWSVNGFRNGVEYRYPLLDKRIIEYMLKIPTHLLCQDNEDRLILRELGKELFSGDSWFNSGKADPAFIAAYRVNSREAAVSFMEEVPEWRSAPEMEFVSFDKLCRDMERFRQDSFPDDPQHLFYSLVTFKAIREFLRVYYGETLTGQTAL